MLLYSMLGQRFLIVILLPRARGKFICPDVMSVIAPDMLSPKGDGGGGGRTPTDIAADIDTDIAVADSPDPDPPYFGPKHTVF